MDNNRIAHLTSYGDHRERIPVPSTFKLCDLEKRYGRMSDSEVAQLMWTLEKCIREVEACSRTWVMMLDELSSLHIEYVYRLQRRIPGRV